MIEPRSTTTGPSYICWRCGQRALEGCVHHCPTALPFKLPVTTPAGKRAEHD